jgi:hypothetical protein
MIDRLSNRVIRGDIMASNEIETSRSQEPGMTDQANTVSRPWRRFLRFSVRALIVLVLVIGAWLGWIVRSARIQREAVAAIRRAGGAVEYDWQRTSGKSTARDTPRAPAWLTDLIGVDHFGDVTTVTLRGATDAALAQVGRLTCLQTLELNSKQPPLSDAGRAHLEGLTNLSVLDLSATRVSDAGLAHLKRLTSLSELDLDDTKVSDAGLVYLARLTSLSVLNLGAGRE